MKKHICPMCGDPLKKGSTACSCGYKESLTDRELLRRLARWDRLRTVCSVMLVLGFVVGGVVWWKSGDIRWGLLALFILLAVGIIGLCRCDSRQRKLIWEQMGDLFRSETEQAFGPDTKLPELVIDEADIRRSQMIDRHWEEFQIKNYRQGVHQGVRFSAANVELTHNFEEHVGRDVNDTMTRSVKAFGGVWLICETERQAPEGGYLYRREDQAYGRDALELVPPAGNPGPSGGCPLGGKPPGIGAGIHAAGDGPADGYQRAGPERPAPQLSGVPAVSAGDHRGAASVRRVVRGA